MVKIRYAEYSDKEYWFSVDQHMRNQNLNIKCRQRGPTFYA